jgi:hypothetical protein
VLFEPVDPAHHCGAGDVELFRGMTEAFVFHAGQERLQIVSGCIQCFSGSVLRDHSTEVQ